jgi:hypothetical protein
MAQHRSQHVGNNNPRNVWCSPFGTGKCFLFEHGGRCVFCVALPGLRAHGRPSGDAPPDVDVPISVKAVYIMHTATPAAGPAHLNLRYFANVHNPKSPPTVIAIAALSPAPTSPTLQQSLRITITLKMGTAMYVETLRCFERTEPKLRCYVSVVYV